MGTETVGAARTESVRQTIGERLELRSPPDRCGHKEPKGAAIAPDPEATGMIHVPTPFTWTVLLGRR